MRWLAFAVMAAGIGTAGVVPAPAAEVSIREWNVPWLQTRPRDPAVADNGLVWFVGQNGDYVAALNPDAGTFRRLSLPEGTIPHNVVIGPKGRLWVAGSGNARIIRVFPGSGRQSSYELPDNKGDPHTQRFGPDGFLWFTLERYNALGRLDIVRGDYSIIALPTAGARPYGLDMTDDGDVWFTEFGAGALARLDPGTLKVREYPLPRKEARPRRLAIADDGTVWYTDYRGGYLGRLKPETGRFREWRVPHGSRALPYGMALDGAGRVWFVETGPSPNLLVGFDPERGEFIVRQPIPSGAGSVRNMAYDKARNSLWFGTDANTIGRAQLPENDD